MTTRPARAVFAVLAGLALTAVAGCGAESLSSDVHPGAAAVVNGERITMGEVDDMAEGYCDFVSARLQSAEQAVPMKLVRGSALDILVQREIARQYADEHDVDVRRATRLLDKQADQQAAQNQVTDAERKTFDEVQLQLETSAIYLAVGGADALAAGEDPDTEAINAGMATVEEWAQEQEVDYDPRFATTLEEEYDIDSGALSRPVSTLAGLAADYDPREPIDSTYFAALPATQTCGP